MSDDLSGKKPPTELQYHFASAKGVTDIVVTEDGILLRLRHQFDHRPATHFSLQLQYEDIPNQLFHRFDPETGTEAAFIGMSRDFVTPHQVLQALSQPPKEFLFGGGLGSYAWMFPVMSPQEAGHAITALGIDAGEVAPFGKGNKLVHPLEHEGVDRMEMDGRELVLHLRKDLGLKGFSYPERAIMDPLNARRIRTGVIADRKEGVTARIDLTRASPELALNALVDIKVLTPQQAEAAKETFRPLMERFAKLRSSDSQMKLHGTPPARGLPGKGGEE